MRIENNSKVMAMLVKAKGQLEHKIRTAYNAGYRDGLKDGATEIIDKLSELRPKEECK